jgi:hypothetical protein
MAPTLQPNQSRKARESGTRERARTLDVERTRQMAVLLAVPAFFIGTASDSIRDSQ